MSNSLACVVIASRGRGALLDDSVLPSLLATGFETIVVGDYHEGSGYRYFPVPPLTHTTTDALVKRDVGTLATDAEWIFYLSDDHRVSPQFVDWIRILPIETFDICVPGRFVLRDGQPLKLNMGLAADDPNRPYCGGHAGLFRRSLIQRRPWSTMPHDRLWDLHSSRIYMDMGAKLVGTVLDYVVEDMTPETEPWK